MTKAKKYWKGLAQLNDNPLVDKLEQNEFVDEIPVDEFLGDKELSSTSTSRKVPKPICNVMNAMSIPFISRRFISCLEK